MHKLPVDLKGSAYLVFFSFLMASNQIAIKLGNQGFDPVFMAGARSILGLLALLAWMYCRSLLVFPFKTNFLPGLLLGVLFAMEFWCLFKSLDYTSVARASIIFSACNFDTNSFASGMLQPKFYEISKLSSFLQSGISRNLYCFFWIFIMVLASQKILRIRCCFFCFSNTGFQCFTCKYYSR